MKDLKTTERMNRKSGYFIFLFIMVAFICQAQSIFTCKEGKVSFFSEAPMENIEAHSTSVNSFLNTSTKEVAFIISIRGFRFAKSLMQEHFNEKYLESDKYPNATFKGKINEEVDFTKDGIYLVTSTGKMNIHGVEKQITHTGKLTVKKNEINLVSDFDVAIKDYNITIPKLLFQNIADTVRVKMDVNYIPYQK
jgi:hypothetical protein